MLEGQSKVKVDEVTESMSKAATGQSVLPRWLWERMAGSDSERPSSFRADLSNIVHRKPETLIRRWHVGWARDDLLVQFSSATLWCNY
jgi:hypothetical protein